MSDPERPTSKPEQQQGAPDGGEESAAHPGGAPQKQAAPKLGAFPRIAPEAQPQAEPGEQPHAQSDAQPQAEPGDKPTKKPGDEAAQAVGDEAAQAVGDEAAQAVGDEATKKPDDDTALTASRRALLGARVAYPLAFLSGLLYFVAFPGIEAWPLAFVALAPLIVALRGQRPRRAAGLGWVTGFAMTMFGFYWLLGMLETFSGFPTAVCLVFMSILCAYQAGRVALCGWLYARAESRGWPPGPVFALAFAASELVYPLLFPWTYAATVHQLPALLQLAELAGPIGVALVLVAANLAVAEPIIARLGRRAVRWRRVAALAAVPLLAASYGAVRIPQVDAATAAAPKARVGIVQANLSLLGKRRDKREGLRRHLLLTQKLQQDQELDLVVWSETSVMGVVHEKRAPRLLRRRVTARLGVPALFGSVLMRPVDDERGYVLFNSALLSDERGVICKKCRYDKQFLLAFGEYLPLGETFPVLYKWSPNSGRFAPGTSLEPLPLGEHEIAVFICYEDIIPSFVNSIMREGEVDLLVNMTNDAWFGDSTEPWIHLALAKFRAIEHRRFLIRSTNSGVSAFVDPVGRVVAHTGTFTEEAIANDIAWLRPTTLFGVLGNAPWWLATVAAFAFAFVRRRSTPKRHQDN